MKHILLASMLMLATPAAAGTIITTGIVCDNTCLSYQPGDDTQDYLGLFGPILGDLQGDKFTLVQSATGYSLTINNHTLTFGLNDPHYTIDFTDPITVGFGPGAARFEAIGSINAFGFTNLFGFAVPETEFLCPEPPFTPGVPEPATWVMFLIGFLGLGALFRKRRQPQGRFTVRAL